MKNKCETCLRGIKSEFNEIFCRINKEIECKENRYKYHIKYSMIPFKIENKEENSNEQSL